MSVCWLKVAICYMCLMSHAAGYFSLHDFWVLVNYNPPSSSSEWSSSVCKKWVCICTYVYIYIQIQHTYTNIVLTCSTPPETKIRKAENEDLEGDFGFQGDAHNSTVKMVRIFSLATFSKSRLAHNSGFKSTNFTHKNQKNEIQTRICLVQFCFHFSFSSLLTLNKTHRRRKAVWTIHPMLPNTLAVGTDPHLE